MAHRPDDDPFDGLFREIERLMDSVMGVDVNVGVSGGSGADTHVDVHEYEDHLVVIADLPGVAKEDIELQCSGRALSIRARGPIQSYDDRVRLPTAIDQNSASASYNNGVLEVELARADDSANIDVT